MPIEVRVSGRGSAIDEVLSRDPAMVAHCDVCARDVELAVSIGVVFACKECIRLRLDATSVASWQLRAADDRGLPWGKISG